ncbi:hypothetical protein [Paraflavitalea speifideaquila]|uniref:hypothetical protein n=1 Tax=Paraflavitalea speifideaquila TaxID=3076558 RepID=UPI0028EA9D2F|nr:hypothetical protein [Paraflavitalea speifideiaquila]
MHVHVFILLHLPGKNAKTAIGGIEPGYVEGVKGIEKEFLVSRARTKVRTKLLSLLNLLAARESKTMRADKTFRESSFDSGWLCRPG